jgi:starvation-inducible DNA-binding protein
MHRTRNDLSEKTRRKVVDVLQPRLAEALDLSMQAKQAHWNVKGPQFSQLHALFDQVHAHVYEQVDEIAERIVQLGGQAAGTVQAVGNATGLPPYPLDAGNATAHLEALAASLAAYGREIRRGIDATAEVGDAGTADLFTGISQQCDKDLWMLEAHLHPAT